MPQPQRPITHLELFTGDDGSQRANELGAKVDAVLKELRHATKKSGWGQLTQ